MEEVFTGKTGLGILLTGIVSLSGLVFIAIFIKHLFIVKKLNKGKDRIYTDVFLNKKDLDSKMQKHLLKSLAIKEKKFTLLLSKYMMSEKEEDKITLQLCYNNMIQLRNLLSESNNGLPVLKEESLNNMCKIFSNKNSKNNCNFKVSKLKNIIKDIDNQLTNKR